MSADVVSVARADAQLLVGYLKNMLRSFTNIPQGMDPRFYHTLSYDGDVAEGERLAGLVGRLEACIQKE